MCSRYELNASPRQLARQFSLSTSPTLPNQSEIRPTDQGLIITPQKDSKLKAWGIPASWDGKPIFNARAESLSEKPTFRPFLNNRCIVPATAFPEWRKDGKQRFKYRISVSRGTAGDGTEPAIMAFAGLYDATHYTIITCAAAPCMAVVHNRMPVILSSDAMAVWLNPDYDFSEVASVMIPYLADDLLVKEEPTGKTVQADLFT